jgi:hypothetical protein
LRKTNAVARLLVRVHERVSRRRSLARSTAQAGGAAAEPSTPPTGLPRRSSWATFALAGAFCTVAVTTLVSALGLPESLTQGRTGALLKDRDTQWIIAVGLCAVIAIMLGLAADRLWRRARRPALATRVVAGLALGGFAMFFGLATWQDKPFAPLPDTWLGFSAEVALIGFLVAMLALTLVFSVRFDRRALFTLAVVVVAGLGILPLIETPHTFSTGYDNPFTLDEILAPSLGRMAGFDYVSQYQTLLGYPLALAKVLAPHAFASHPESFAVAWLIILQMATLVGANFAVLRVTPPRVRWLVPLIIIPVTYLVGVAGLQYYADLPMRFALPTALLLVVSGMRQVRRPWAWWTPVLIGVLAGATVLNNLDFGLPALAAALVAISITSPNWIKACRTVALFVGGALASPMAYIAIGSLRGKHFDPDKMLFFIRGFAVEGEGRVDMLPIGLHTAFVFLGIVGAVIGALGSRGLRGRNRVLHQAMVYQSLWLLFSLVYFSGRSLTATLVTGSAFGAAVLLAMLFVAGHTHLESLRRVGFRNWLRDDWIAATLTVASLALPLAALASFPTPERSTGRLYFAIHPTDEKLAWMGPDPRAAVAALPADTRLMGVLTVAGSMWGPKLDVPNANLFLHPNYLAFSGAADMECAYLETLPGETLLTTRHFLGLLSSSATCVDVLDFGSVEVPLPDPSDTGEAQPWVLVSRR